MSQDGKDQLLHVVWEGHKPGELIHSRFAYPVLSLIHLWEQLEALGAVVLYARREESLPRESVPWTWGDPGSEYFRQWSKVR